MQHDLSELAQRLGRYMAESLTDGLAGYFDDRLLEVFPDEDRSTLKMALAELEGEGLVTLSPLIGPKLPRVHTTVDLFVACDSAVTGHDPIDDSVILARMLVADRNLGGNARDLEVASGWERRRFNPAFALIIPHIAEGRVRTAYQPDYPVLGVLVDDEDVVRLRRHIQQNVQ